MGIDSIQRKLLLVINVDWFFLSHRLPIALKAINEGYEVHIATAITDRLEILENYGFIVHKLELDRSSSGFFTSLSSIKQIYHLFIQINPDVIHLVTIKPVIFGGIATRLARSPAVVVAISGLGFVFFSSGFLAALRRQIVLFLYNLALGSKNIAIIFQNDNDKKILSQKIDLSNKSVYLIPGSGVDLTKYVVNPLPEGITTVMLLARLIADKGVWEFVEAARILKSDDLRFVLVGDVDKFNPTSLSRDDIEGFVREGIIEYWGYRSDIPNVLSQAHIVVLPSYYGEGLPKILIEAAACGRAVITTDHPGCRDAIEANVSGLLVPIKDAAALARAIATLADDLEVCRSMGMHGRHLAEEKYDVNKVVATHLQIYADLSNKALSYETDSK